MEIIFDKLTGNPRKLFDLESEADDKELQSWCRAHWHDTLCKAVKGANVPYYHDCCISFTKKGCVKRFSHPPLQTSSVLKIPSLRYTRSPEELHRWLKERYKVHKQLGLKTYFPSINIAHSDIEEVVCHGDYCNSLETLGKRNQILSYENQKSNEELTVLREENRRLLGAVKRWHDKYQDILLRTQDEAPSYTETTPVKKFKTSCSTTDDLVLMRSG